MSLVQLYKRDEYGFFSVKPSNYLMAVTMPHILERYDSLVKPIDDDIFIGVCSMQLFEGINRPVKKAFKNQFNGRFDPATLLKNSLIFYRPNFIMTPSIGTQLQELSEPASLVRVLAGQNLVPTPEEMRNRKRAVFGNAYFESHQLDEKEEWYCTACGSFSSFDFNQKKTFPSSQMPLIRFKDVYCKRGRDKTTTRQLTPTKGTFSKKGFSESVKAGRDS